MELNDLRKLSGLNECGMSPMPSTPPSPASISMTAASGSELSGMLKDIMSLAGMHKVEPAHLGVEPPPMKLLPEPVKAVGPAASDGEVMRGITDKLNLDKDDDEKKADESWDNEPASPQPEEAFDANQYAHHENPPGAAKGRNFKNNPVANVEDVAEQLFADYQSFLAENVFEDDGDLKESVLDVLKQIYAGANSGQDMIDVLADELGDYFDDVKMSGDKTLQNAYMLMRNQGMEAEGNPKLMAQVAKKAIDLLSDKSGVFEDEGKSESTLMKVFNEHDFMKIENVWPALEQGDKNEALGIVNDYLASGARRAWWGKLQAVDVKIDPSNVENSVFVWNKDVGLEEGPTMEDPSDENENLTLAMSALHSAADDLYEAGFSEEAEQVLRIYHDLEEKTQSGDEELPEEKSWFDMTSAERQADYYKKGGGRPQPGHSAAPAKTAKGDIMRTAKDVKAHTKGKQDEH